MDTAQAEGVEPQKPVPPDAASAADTALYITVVLGVEVANNVLANGLVQEEALVAVPYPFGEVESYTNSACARIFAKLALIAASAPLDLAVFSEASTTEAKMPIIATTTKSSIKVKPFCKLIFFIIYFC